LFVRPPTTPDAFLDLEELLRVALALNADEDAMRRLERASTSEPLTD
jgi:hypothetical protein